MSLFIKNEIILIILIIKYYQEIPEQNKNKKK